MQIHRMIIKSFDEQTGEAVVESASGQKVMFSRKAYFVSKMPPGSTGYEQAYPRPNDRCLVAEVGNEWFILGFYKLPTAGSNKYKSTNTDIHKDNAGGYKIEGAMGHYLSLDGFGNIDIFSSLWSKLKLFKSAGQLWGKFYSFIMDLGGGKIRWTKNGYDKIDFVMEIDKVHQPLSDVDLEFGDTPSTTPDFPFYADKLIVRSRPEDKHFELEVRQAIESDSPNTQLLTTLGKNQDNVHKSEYIKDKDGREFSTKILTTDELYVQSFKNGEAVTYQVVNNDGSMTININDKAAISIASNGEITIQSSDRNLFLGKPDGSRLGLLTTDFLDLFIKHTHMSPTGTNVGVPGYIDAISPSNYMSVNIVVSDNLEQEGQFLLSPNKKIYTSRVKAD